LIVPLFKKLSQPRPFLVYEINNTKYVLLKITTQEKDYIPQFLLVNKPNNLHKTSYIDLNILVHISHDLFPYILNRTLGLEKQGKLPFQEDLNKIMKDINSCFNNNKSFRGNRYEVRVR
jgi:hypothetical protein